MKFSLFLLLLVAEVAYAGVYIEFGEHPNSDVQLPFPFFSNLTLEPGALAREFPQYNYAQQGDLIGFFDWNPAQLVIWSPVKTVGVDTNPSGPEAANQSPIPIFSPLVAIPPGTPQVEPTPPADGHTPEPSTFVLCFLGIGAVLALMRRHGIHKQA